LDKSEQGSAIVREAFGGFSPGANAAFWISVIPAQQRHSELAQGGEVLRGLSLANPATILTKGDIEYPVQGVFDPPMATGCRGEGFGSGNSLVANKISALTGNLALDLACPFEQA
jgi:hypothetical protein